MVISILESNFEEYDCSSLGIFFDLLPAQGSISKSSPNYEFVKNDSIYQRDDFYSLPLVELSKYGVYRSVSIAGIKFSPIAYNPVSKRIRIQTKTKVKVDFWGVDNQKTQDIRKYSSKMFGISDDVFVNKSGQLRSEYSDAPISYLIVAHSMFRQNQELNEFIEWKKKLGYIVNVAYTDDPNVGTTKNSITQYIRGYFDNATTESPAPLFLLLVGDVEQIPAYQGVTEDRNHVTDLYYATHIGNDNLPDCYYGRFSAKNQADLSNQIRKILIYEQFTMPDPSYLGSAVLIAGYDEYYATTHANGQINYINQNYINNQNPRYQNVNVHLHDCSSQAALIRNEVSQGAGWVNYTAHGYIDSWHLPKFDISHIYKLQNINKCGVVIGNCCLTGKFETNECFAEAFLRAPEKGAIAYIGASNSSYWDEDFYWAVGIRANITSSPIYSANNLGVYDRLFHTHGESSSNYISTLGGVINAGNMSVQNSSSSLKQYYWEIYHCFGDPSVRPYLGIPSTMAPSYNSAITLGEQEFIVHSVPFAYVALVKDDEFICATFADQNGLATLDVSPILIPGEYQLSISAQNYVPYFNLIQVIVPNAPFVIANKAQVPQNTDFLTSSFFSLDLELENVGSVEANAVYAKITTQNPDVALVSDSVYVGTISSQGLFNQDAAFSFTLPNDIKDNTNYYFDLLIHWNNDEFVRQVKVTTKIPDMQLNSVVTEVQDLETVMINPGDEVTYIISSTNKGHAKVTQGICDLTCNYSGVEVLSPSSVFGDIDYFETIEKPFSIKISEDVPLKSMIPLYYHTLYGPIHKIDTIYLKIGLNIETFESGDFSQNSWSMNNKPWIITDEVKFSGNYSARSALNTGNMGRSRMWITTTTTEQSQFSYYRKVSTEESYDIFTCSINDNIVDEASGDIDWTKIVVDVPAGTNIFKFTYEKDGNFSYGNDCVWVDEVLVPENGLLVVEDVYDEVGVESYNTSQSVKVYPNPTHQWLTIESNNLIKNYIIYDLNGRRLSMGNLNGGKANDIDMQNFPSGIYLLQIKTENNSVKNFKIIKK